MSSARWPLFTSSQELPVFFVLFCLFCLPKANAKSCLKLPPLSSYRMPTGFWFRLAERHSQLSKRDAPSLKWSRRLLKLHSALMTPPAPHPPTLLLSCSRRDEQWHEKIVFQKRFCLRGCCSFAKKQGSSSQQIEPLSFG